MTVDFRNPADILVVHGVEVSEDAKIEAAKQIETLVNRALLESHIIDKQFTVKGFFYEDINDASQRFYQAIAAAITAGHPLEGVILKNVIDLVGDVVTAAIDNSTAALIRTKLREAILESYDNGRQLILVSHSLGTVYGLDAIVELMKDQDYFHGDDVSTWPVRGFVTMGSPLGLALQIGDVKIFDKRQVAGISGAEYTVFPWHNYYNPLDPIVSGHVFGSPVTLEGARGPVEQRYGPDLLNTNWKLRGHAVTSGNQWLAAHVQYWTNPHIGDQILDMLWG